MSDSPLILPVDKENKVLVSNTHPPKWENPEPASKYDLVVMGAGTAGLVTASGAAGAVGAVIGRDLCA